MIAASTMAEKQPVFDPNAWLMGLSALVGAMAAAATRIAPWLRKRAQDRKALAAQDRQDAEGRYDRLQARLEGENTRLWHKIAELDSKFHEVEVERVQLMAINAAQATELTTLQVQVDGQRGQISYLTEENGRLSAKVDRLEGENSALKAKVRHLERLERATHEEPPSA